jgi:hypothetical protein
MSTPSTITQRLETQHPELLPEVVMDLQLLRWEKLCERISQWMFYLSDILSKWWIAEDVATLTMIQSPRNQLAFLREHLCVTDIIAVLNSVDSGSSIVDYYLKQKSIITPEDDDIGETLLAWAFTNYMKWYSRLSVVCKDLTVAMGHLLKKEQNVWWYTHLQRQLVRWTRFFANTVVETNDVLRYKKAVGLYSLAQQALTKLWTNAESIAIELLMSSARVYRNAGQTVEAFGAYSSALAKSIDWHDRLEANDVTAWVVDPVYTQWRVFLAQQQHDDATQFLLLSWLFMVQLKIEEIQDNLIANDEDMLPAIHRDLDDAYEILKNKGWIESWLPSAYAVANVWRFTYGRYMMLVNEPLYARKELDLLDKDATPEILYTAKNYLLDGYTISFIETQNMDQRNVKWLILVDK